MCLTWIYYTFCIYSDVCSSCFMSDFSSKWMCTAHRQILSGLKRLASHIDHLPLILLVSFALNTCLSHSVFLLLAPSLTFPFSEVLLMDWSLGFLMNKRMTITKTLVGLLLSCSKLQSLLLIASLTHSLTHFPFILIIKVACIV